MDQEPFEYFDEVGKCLGIKSRGEVHQQGLWHRSAQVFLFNPAGELLLQKRAANKDLYAGLWDYSVGEHLQPGESFHDGANRGLHEELGVTGATLEPVGTQRQVTLTGENFIDREIQQAFTCVYAGSINPDPDEVAQIQYADLNLVARWVERAVADFTPWFVNDLREFGWLDVK